MLCDGKIGTTWAPSSSFSPPTSADADAVVVEEPAAAGSLARPSIAADRCIKIIVL